MRFFTILFRFRSWILGLIFFFAFWAPFERVGGAHPGSTWLFLAGMLASHGRFSIAYASIAVMGVAILLALVAALLRTWAAAYLGRSVVQDAALHSDRVVADGPYRYLRNPLYVGVWLHTLALAILMPPGGALFAVVAVAILNAALIHTEEHRLMAKGGEVYAAYMRSVPRFGWAWMPRLAAGGTKPNWGNGFLGEIYFWGVCITYLLFASRYNVTILEQGVLISLGVSILMQGILGNRLGGDGVEPQPRT